ncbi:E3 ubiquitin-protein ligase upl7 [Asimina triloba]
MGSPTISINITEIGILLCFDEWEFGEEVWEGYNTNTASWLKSMDERRDGANSGLYTGFMWKKHFFSIINKGSLTLKDPFRVLMLEDTTVSLRGSSSKEITRDALLEKVSFERELRNYTRRAAAAALFIQKVWRRHHVAKKVARQFQEEWEILIGQHDILITNPKKNFCSMVVGTPDERSTWLYQARKLVSICSFILDECDHTFLANGENKIVTSLVMQLVIALTDPRSWKSFSKANHKDACIAARKLIQFIASGRSGLYISVRRHIMKFSTPLQRQNGICTDDHFLITASALTLALRPFHVVELCLNDVDPIDVQNAAEQYCTFLLTVPLLSQCLPRVLLPALKHESVLSPCLRTLLISKEELFVEMSKLDQLKDCTYCSNLIPSCGWALANMISLATEQDNGSIESGHFIQGLQSRVYVHSAINFSENLLHQLENIGSLKNCENDEHVTNYVPSEKVISTDVSVRPTYSGSSTVSYVEAIKPVYQQWHLLRLLAISKKDISVNLIEVSDKLELIDVAVFYSNMLSIVSFLDPLNGSLPMLNMLSFTPGFLVELWRVLEASLFCQGYHRDMGGKHMDGVSGSQHDVVMGKKLGRIEKDAGNKWTSVLQKITGKSSNNVQYINSTIDHTLVTDDVSDLWDVESMRRGSQGISKEISCLLHVFSATYAHLLLVLDDIEFYEKQVPLLLEQQRKIAAVLNTLVYNGFSHNIGDQNKPLMDTAVRCLHLLYERDCRHQFCPLSLWIAPARKGRPPIAAAARAHEAVTANLKSVDTLTGSCSSSVINKIPHVFPFEER